MEMASRSFLGLGPHGFHRVGYTEWGDADAARTVVCVHGLTRNGRDFDHLAAALAGEARVVCPDVAGRGASDWLPVAEDYGYPQYCADMAALIARLGVAQVDWVGTSMGGLIGMMLAAQPKTPIRRLVLNDVGPFVPKAALERLGGYVGKDPRFADLEGLEAYLREIYMDFGALSDDQWRHLAEHSARQTEAGLGLAYDPAIGAPLADPETLEDVDIWPVWDAITCPVLLLRGRESDVLPAEVAAEMTGRGPGADLRNFDSIGHAPALMDAEQIALIRQWLKDA